MFRPQVYETDPRVRKYIVPVRVVRTTGDVTGTAAMLQPRPAQISLTRPEGWEACRLRNGRGVRASLLVDFGCEIHGSVRLYAWGAKHDGRNAVKACLRFGESVSEAMTPVGTGGATNDHANRDMVVNVGFLSANETNETGFRFLNVELLDDDAELELYMIQGVMIGRELEQVGSFACSDPRVNEIYDTAVYTAHVNMQEYLWDGIKRDRLVWCGDIYPSELTILAAYGAHEILQKSLEQQSCMTAPDAWMNGLPAYNLWWLMAYEEVFMAGGDLSVIRAQHGYMKEQVRHLARFITADGVQALPQDFLDWPNSENPDGMHAGQQALMVMAFTGTARMMRAIGDEETAAFCEAQAERMKHVHLPHGGSKQAAALLALAGIESAEKMNDEVIAPGGAHGYSTFLGYATLAAKAAAGDMTGALRDMREYWGGMLDMGATTFWEDFNLDWLDNAAPIDEVVPEGKKDIHGDFGAYCYTRLRHSLCHAWASGPAPFLMRWVLGVKVLEPGCRKMTVRPDLGDLAWAEGDWPTPMGAVHIRCERTPDGVKTTVSAPEGVEIV